MYVKHGSKQEAGMSQFSGKQFKGAMRQRRQLKREQAVARNAATQPERRRSYRRQAKAA